MKKNGLTIAAALCMAVVLTACSGSGKTETQATTDKKEVTEETSTTAKEAESQDSKAEGGKLVMVTNAEFPPYEYHENNEIVGIDADIAKAIADKMGMELEIKDMAFESLIPAIQAGKADFAAAGMTISEDRKKNVDFTDTYAKAAQVIIVKEESEIKTKDDLTGKKIGVQTGTTGDIYADDIEDGTVQRFNKGMDAVMSLTQGKIDAVIIDREPAKVFLNDNDNLKILDEAFTEEEYAIALKKDNTQLLDKMNGAIKELKESGELKKIVDHYITAE